MLKYLHIENIILMENIDLGFDRGLNVITGETGSGKSAIIHALALVLGERANPNVIRHGAEKAVVEALFEIQSIPEIAALLREVGIEIDRDEELSIRREITNSGKNRIFIQNCASSLALVKQVGELLMRFVSQHSNHMLRELATHRETVDLFANLTTETKQFANEWKQLKKLHRELEELREAEGKRVREIEILRQEIEEIETVGLKTGEEEELYQEFSKLSQSEELSQTVQHLTQGLEGDEVSALGLLNALKPHFEKAVSIDPKLKEVSDSYQQQLLELQEIHYELAKYQAKIEFNPFRCQELSDRLASIKKLRKKYGASIEEVLAHLEKASARLSLLENIDSRKEELEKKITLAEKTCDKLAMHLTQKRKVAAKQLETAILRELQSLNMKQSHFEIRISLQPRSESGDDEIEMYLAPNVGEKCVPLRECASGGEMSRIVLALHTLLAEKEKIRLIVFDEVDANIGGETATSVGEKLEQIGQAQQVICITHFPQVAMHAHHHIQIHKVETNGRTLTQVRVLNLEERTQEIQRMVGGKSAYVFARK